MSRGPPPSGWYAEIDVDGQLVRPRILDQPQHQPAVNDLPRIEIPVPSDDTWQAGLFDDIPLRVWRDGDRQPIDRLEHRRQQPDRTVLEGRGGLQLERRIIEDIDIEPTHELLERLVTEYTDYDVQIDSPGAGSQTDVLIQAADADFELQTALEEIVAMKPVAITDDGALVPLQASWVIDANADGPSGSVAGDLDGGGIAENPAYSGGLARTIRTDSDEITGAFALEYDIPDGDAILQLRMGVDGGNHGFEIYVDGTQIDTIQPDSLNDGVDYNFTLPLDGITAGTHTVELRPKLIPDPDYQGDGEAPLVLDEGSADVEIDFVAIHDDRYEFTFDNEVHADNGYLDGPEPYPDVVRVETNPISTRFSILEHRVSATTTHGGALPEVGIGQNGTDSFSVATETTSFGLEYDELSATARARFGVGRRTDVTRDDRTPRTGFAVRGVDGFEQVVDFDVTPVVTNRFFEGQLVDVMREVADYGDFVFEVQTDPDTTTNGGLRIEGTQLDGRLDPTVDPDLVDYEIDRQTEGRLEQAVVYGGAERVEGVDIDRSDYLFSFHPLPFPDSRLVEGRERVYRVESASLVEDSDGNITDVDLQVAETFERGVDYEIKHSTAQGRPELKIPSDSSIEFGDDLRIDADVKPRGEYVDPQADPDDPDLSSRTVDIPGLASLQMCNQVALFLVQETDDVITEVELTVPTDELEWSVIAAIDPDRLPGEGPYQTRAIEVGAGEARIRLASRQSVGEIVDEIRQATSRNAERV